MKIETMTFVAAPATEIRDYMLSDAYVEDLIEHLEAVSNIDEFSVIRRGDRIEQRMRFEAPTKLPGMLERYEARMPSFVYWQELGRWESGAMEMRFEIIPEAPDSWRDRYDHRGVIRLTEVDSGTEIVQILEFEVHVFGLGKLIERTLGPEIKEIFEARGEVIRKRFLL
jgi:hypothetical protein